MNTHLFTTVFKEIKPYKYSWHLLFTPFSSTSPLPRNNTLILEFIIPMHVKAFFDLLIHIHQ